MKKYVSLLCLVCAMFGPAIGVKAQNPQLTNHYAMKLVECEQSKLFAEAVKQKGGKTVLDIYPSMITTYRQKVLIRWRKSSSNRSISSRRI